MDWGTRSIGVAPVEWRGKAIYREYSRAEEPPPNVERYVTDPFRHV